MEGRCGEGFYTRPTKLESKCHIRVSPRISSLKLVFQRDKYREYILYTTRRGAVSGVPLKATSTFSLRVV